MTNIQLSELQTDLVEPLESFVEKRIKNLKVQSDCECDTKNSK